MKSVLQTGVSCPVGHFCAGGSEDKQSCTGAWSTGWSYCKTFPPLNENVTEVIEALQKEQEELRTMLLVVSKNLTQILGPKLSVSTVGLHLWGQAQYKYCQPVFNSWTDMRARRRNGSLKVKMGGLGELMVEGEYESWVCVYDDACSLGGDDYFCYVFQERTLQFIPWDQHFNLRIFQPK